MGAGVLGWPTSRWMTVSPAASFSAAAAITSMTMNGSTAPPRRESLPDIGGVLAADGEQRETQRPPGRYALWQVVALLRSPDGQTMAST